MANYNYSSNSGHILIMARLAMVWSFYHLKIETVMTWSYNQALPDIIASGNHITNGTRCWAV